MSFPVARRLLVITLIAGISACGRSGQQDADSMQAGPDAIDSAAIEAAAPVDASGSVVPDSSLAAGGVPDGAALALEGEGLRVFVSPSGSARPLPFGTQAEDLLAIVTRVLNAAPVEEGTNPECNLDFATWSNGLTATFTQSGFAGWSVRGESALTTVSGVGIGSTRADLMSAYSVNFHDSSLGVEFTAGNLAGILDSDSPSAVVQHLWAGQVCLAR